MKYNQNLKKVKNHWSLIDTLILGQHIAKICMRVTATELLSGEPLFPKFQFYPWGDF
jgi:hypothetical protein